MSRETSKKVRWSIVLLLFIPGVMIAAFLIAGSNIHFFLLVKILLCCLGGIISFAFLKVFFGLLLGLGEDFPSGDYG